MTTIQFNSLEIGDILVENPRYKLGASAVLTVRKVEDGFFFDGSRSVNAYFDCGGIKDFGYIGLSDHNCCLYNVVSKEAELLK